ncbi:MAG: hypothetical protein AAF658_01255, partial [Myxococcota bacterium]
MRFGTFFVFGALGVFVWGCGDSEPTRIQATSGRLAVDTNLELRTCTADTADALAPGSPTSVNLQDVRILGDRLVLAISFAGGCDSHAFSLCWDGTLTDSVPPEANLRLRHETMDTCEALLSESLEFDLRPIEEALGDN